MIVGDSLEQKDVKKQLDSIRLGDLICVDWCDASTGKSSGSEAIDVPVKSWGIFIGVLGVKTKHIVLAQNTFCYADDLFDLDYTAIPLSWAIDLTTIVKDPIPKDAADKLVNAFLAGQRHPLARPRTFQRTIFSTEVER